MRAIIIEDKDSLALLASLKLQRLDADNVFHVKEKPEGWTEEQWRKDVVDGLHRSFHFVVVRWLQEQGCNVVR